MWLGLHEPTTQELDQVRDAFGPPELAVEDARTFGWLTGPITSLATFVIYGIGALVVSLALLRSWLRLRRAGADAGAAAGNNLQPRANPRPASSP